MALYLMDSPEERPATEARLSAVVEVPSLGDVAADGAHAHLAALAAAAAAAADAVGGVVVADAAAGLGGASGGLWGG